MGQSVLSLFTSYKLPPRNGNQNAIIGQRLFFLMLPLKRADFISFELPEQIG
jgi:hypothetical protein